MSQSSITNKQDAAFAGQLGDSTTFKDVLSYISEESSAEIRFGVMVKQGTASDQCLLLSAATDVDKLLGAVVHSHAYNKDNELGSTGIKPKCMVGALARGRMWVISEEAVAPGDAVRVRHTAGAGGTVLGAFRKTAAANETILLTSARWRSTLTTAGGIALVEYELSAETGGTADT